VRLNVRLNVVMLNVAAPFFIRFALIAAKRKKNEIFCRFLLTLNASIESDGASTKIQDGPVVGFLAEKQAQWSE
jgi:hypothetical protein